MRIKYNCSFSLDIRSDSRFFFPGLIAEFSLTVCQQTWKIQSQNLDSKWALLSYANLKMSGITTLSENQVDDN